MTHANKLMKIPQRISRTMLVWHLIHWHSIDRDNAVCLALSRDTGVADIALVLGSRTNPASVRANRARSLIVMTLGLQVNLALHVRMTRDELRQVDADDYVKFGVQLHVIIQSNVGDYRLLWTCPMCPELCWWLDSSLSDSRQVKVAMGTSSRSLHWHTPLIVGISLYDKIKSKKKQLSMVSKLFTVACWMCEEHFYCTSQTVDPMSNNTTNAVYQSMLLYPMRSHTWDTSSRLKWHANFQHVHMLQVDLLQCEILGHSDDIDWSRSAAKVNQPKRIDTR